MIWHLGEKMGIIVDTIKNRDTLIHSTRREIALSVRDAILIDAYNKFLEPFGFPVRDTHEEPDGYNEAYWWKVAEAKEMKK